MVDQAVFSDLSLCQANGGEGERNIVLRTCTHRALEPTWEVGGTMPLKCDGGIPSSAMECHLPNSALVYKKKIHCYTKNTLFRIISFL